MNCICSQYLHLMQHAWCTLFWWARLLSKRLCERTGQNFCWSVSVQRSLLCGHSWGSTNRNRLRRMYSKAHTLYSGSLDCTWGGCRYFQYWIMRCGYGGEEVIHLFERQGIMEGLQGTDWRNHGVQLKTFNEIYQNIRTWKKDYKTSSARIII